MQTIRNLCHAILPLFLRVITLTMGQSYSNAEGYGEMYRRPGMHSETVCVFLGIYRQVSNIRGTLVGNKIVDHSDVVGASIACRRCSNYIFILDLTLGFIGLGKDNCKTSRETFKFGDLVRLILEILRYWVSCVCDITQYRHVCTLSGMASQITDNRTVCSIAWSG